MPRVDPQPFVAALAIDERLHAVEVLVARCVDNRRVADASIDRADVGIVLREQLDHLGVVIPCACGHEDRLRLGRLNQRDGELEGRLDECARQPARTSILDLRFGFAARRETPQLLTLILQQPLDNVGPVGHHGVAQRRKASGCALNG